MEERFTNVSWKKGVVILIGIGVVLMGLILIPLLFTSPSKTVVKNIQPSPNLIPTVFNSPSGSSSYSMYSSKFYTVEYPRLWKQTSAAIDNGESVYLNPLGSQAEYIPGLRIDFFPTISEQQIEQKKGGFKTVGFNQSEILVDNTKATQLKGSLTVPKNINGKNSLVATQETHIYLHIAQSLLVINYFYEGKGINATYESEFAKILSTFRLVSH